MSASSTPTRAPSALSASARLAETVDLPTPPLPEATTMMFLTFGSGASTPCTLCGWTRLATDTLAASIAGSASSAWRTRLVSSSMAEAAG